MKKQSQTNRINISIMNVIVHLCQKPSKLTAHKVAMPLKVTQILIEIRNKTNNHKFTRTIEIPQLEHYFSVKWRPPNSTHKYKV